MKTFKQHTQIDEAPLVMSDGEILDTIWNQVKKQLEKKLLKEKLRKLKKKINPVNQLSLL